MDLSSTRTKASSEEERKARRLDSQRKYREANKERLNAEAKARRQRAGREKARKALQSWRERNRDKDRAYQWAKSATEAGRAHNRARRAIRRRAMSAWADKVLVRQFYDLAVVLSKHIGVRYHVDHIIPLCGELVSGLHNEHNLRVIPAIDNLRKNNRYEVS